jgi:hypothetical protein
MTTGVTNQYTLALNEDERTVLLDILETVLKETEIEEHRTDAFRAKELIHARETTIESLLQKTRAARPG